MNHIRKARLERIETNVQKMILLRPAQRERDLEVFRCTAENYLRELRPFLAASLEIDPLPWCHSEADVVVVTRHLVSYYIEALRQNARCNSQIDLGSSA